MLNHTKTICQTTEDSRGFECPSVNCWAFEYQGLECSSVDCLTPEYQAPRTRVLEYQLSSARVLSPEDSSVDCQAPEYPAPRTWVLEYQLPSAHVPSIEYPRANYWAPKYRAAKLLSCRTARAPRASRTWVPECWMSECLSTKPPSVECQLLSTWESKTLLVRAWACHGQDPQCIESEFITGQRGKQYPDDRCKVTNKYWSR